MQVLWALFSRGLLFLFVVSCFLNPVSCYLGDASDSEGENIYVPEINVRGGGLGITSGGTCVFGKIPTSSSRSMQFVIENLGRGYLSLQGNPLVQVSGTDASMFVVTVQPSTPISPYSYRSFTIVFTPATDGVKTATVTIQNSDDDEGTFAFTVTGEGDPNIAPEIHVMQGGTNLNSGIDDYSFGSIEVGSSVGPVTFAIYNKGTAALNVTSVTLSGPDYTDFDDTNFTGFSGTIDPGLNDVFTVTFKPVSSVGSKNALITIKSNDSDEGTYTFTIKGDASVVPAPDIYLSQGGTPLPDETGEYDFGEINQGLSSADIEFTISNKGDSDLNITDITNSNVKDFAAIFPSGTSFTVASGSSDTFTVQFTPKNGGLRSSDIEITNNDPVVKKQIYSIKLKGTGVAVPEIVLTESGSDVAINSTKDFGSILYTDTKELTFKIENQGSGDLVISGDDKVVITGVTIDEEFKVSQDPVSPITSGGNTTFKIKFQPKDVGNFSGTVYVQNNDSNENPYFFNIKGVATAVPAPEINVLQGSSNLLNNSEYDFGGMTVGGAVTEIEFTIQNIGSADLKLNGTPIVDLGSSKDFVLSSVDPSTPLGASGSTTFKIKFDAQDVGDRTATMTIANDDSDEKSFTLTLKGVGTSPEMDLEQNSTSIAVNDDVAFGNTGLGASKVLEFSIKNTTATASALLLSGSPIVSPAVSGDFSVSMQPSASSVAPGGDVKFSIKYTPSATGAASGSFSITNNDVNENPYTFTVSGEGVNPTINIPEVANGGTIDIGSHKYNTSYQHSFNVNNTGTAGVLTLKSNPHVIVSGTDASFFTVELADQPATTIGHGGSSTFKITFNPTNSSSAGLKTATVSVYSDDVNTPVYSFTVTGTVTVPDINIRQGGTDLVDGVGTYPFGNVNVGTGGVEVEFTIQNTGDADLTITGTHPAYVVVDDNTHFTVTQQPTTATPGTVTVGSGGTTSFKITYTPQDKMHHSTTVRVFSDDPDVENEYTFTIDGTGVDTIAPTVTSVDSPMGNPTWRGTKTLSVTASDNVGVESVSYYIDSVSAPNLINTSSNVSPYEVSINTISYGDGAHTIIAQAVDAVPNTSTNATAGFTIDNTAPTITISGPSAAIAKNGTNVTYTITYSDTNFNASSLAVGDITLNTTGVANGNVSVDVGTGATRTVTISNITFDGTIGISIAAGTASDTAGNTALGAGPSAVFTADNTAPTVTITAPAAGTWDGTQSLTFTPDDGTTDARISTGVWEAKASGVIINTLNGWGPPASGANYTVDVRSTDPAGNIGSASRTYTMP